MVDFFNPAGRDPVGAFQIGRTQEQQRIQQQELFEQQQQTQQKRQGLLQQIFAQPQAGAQGLPIDSSAGTLTRATQPTQQQTLGQLFTVDPQAATQAQAFLQGLDEQQRTEVLRENKVLTRGSLDALSLPEDKRRAFVTQLREKAINEGRDVSILTNALQQDDAGLNQLLNLQAREGLNIEQLAKQQFIQPSVRAEEQRRFERSAGEEQRRFERGTTEEQRKFERGIPEEQRIFERGEESEQSRFERGVVEEQRIFERGQAAKELKKSGIKINVLGRERDVSEIIENAKQFHLKSSGFAKRMASANEDLEALIKSGFNPASAIETARGASNITASEDFRVFMRAQRDFITAQLREESGAVISDQEFDTEEKKFFPKLGDGKRVIALKKAARERAFKTMVNNSVGVFEAQAAIDNVLKNNVTVEDRGQELREAGLSDEAIVEKLIQEGFGEAQ